MDKYEKQRDDWRSRVFETAEALQAEGRKPTREAVKARIGGNPHVIGPLLQEWREAQADALPLQNPTPTTRLMADIETRVARQFQARALEVIARMGYHSLQLKAVAEEHDAYLVQHTHDLQAIEDREATAREQTAALITRWEDAHHAILSAREQRKVIAAEMQMLTGEMETVQAEIVRVEARLRNGRITREKAVWAHAKHMEAGQERLTRLKEARAFARATVERLTFELASNG